MSSTTNLSTSAMQFIFATEYDRVRLQQYTQDGHAWLHPAATAGLFAVYMDNQRYDATSLSLDTLTVDHATAGVQHAVLHFTGMGLAVEHHVKVYHDTALLECWQVVRNIGGDSVQINRLDSCALDIPAAAYELLSYTGDWGSEFEPSRHLLTGEKSLESRSGRSTKGNHPWFALFTKTADGKDRMLSGSVAWSGNWVIRFAPLSGGGYRLSGGLHDWEFNKTLAPGASVESPPFVLVLGNDLNHVSQQYARVGRRHWYPRNAISSLPPFEWNHWWSYEDDHINDAVFRQNVDVAQTMGVEVCTLDAGWFGPSDASTFWYDYRGDWDQINTQRFPQGIRPVADYTHAKGMKFGIWCEIEALGKSAKLAETRPELLALRDGERLGYVCFGNPQTQEFAFQTLSRLIVEYNVDWIKLDFNLDPGVGCNRTDHGHGTGDGLYDHYMGYYRTLERVRQTYPHVVLENCSSGGLRIDLGIMRRTDMTFLSDPDWAVHDLQLFWGATTMLAPDSCLHWSYGDWINKNPPPQQTFNPRDPKLKPHQLDYYTRISMLNVYGLSQKLPELPAWVQARLETHSRLWCAEVRRFVREADLYRLTDQPRRDGSGDRWSAFQYSLPDQTEHLLFVFRLPGASAERSIRPAGLQADRVYHLEGFEGERFPPQTGRDLMANGLTFTTLPEEGSALLRLF